MTMELVTVENLFEDHRALDVPEEARRPLLAAANASAHALLASRICRKAIQSPEARELAAAFPTLPDSHDDMEDGYPLEGPLSSTTFEHHMRQCLDVYINRYRRCGVAVLYEIAAWSDTPQLNG